MDTNGYLIPQHAWELYRKLMPENGSKSYSYSVSDIENMFPEYAGKRGSISAKFTHLRRAGLAESPQRNGRVLNRTFIVRPETDPLLPPQPDFLRRRKTTPKKHSADSIIDKISTITGLLSEVTDYVVENAECVDNLSRIKAALSTVK